jgi:hypothetical protein
MTLVTMTNCQHKLPNLEEIRIGLGHFPILFRCRDCGSILTCTCFHGHFSLENDILRDSQPWKNEPSPTVIIEKAGVCSLCTGIIPRLIYGHEMYYSRFLQRYLPYHTLVARQQFGHDVYDSDPQHKLIEAHLRQVFGYSTGRNQWLSETILYRTVKAALPKYAVVQHYRAKELDRLELDIFVPLLGLGIEYQGRQHYKSMPHWGGDVGYKTRRSNDQRKKRICKKLGYTIVYFNEHDDLAHESVIKKLEAALGRKLSDIEEKRPDPLTKPSVDSSDGAEGDRIA